MLNPITDYFVTYVDSISTWVPPNSQCSNSCWITAINVSTDSPHLWLKTLEGMALHKNLKRCKAPKTEDSQHFHVKPPYCDPVLAVILSLLPVYFNIKCDSRIIEYLQRFIWLNHMNFQDLRLFKR